MTSEKSPPKQFILTIFLEIWNRRSARVQAGAKPELREISYYDRQFIRMGWATRECTKRRFESQNWKPSWATRESTKRIWKRLIVKNDRRGWLSQFIIAQKGCPFNIPAWGWWDNKLYQVFIWPTQFTQQILKYGEDVFETVHSEFQRHYHNFK